MKLSSESFPKIKKCWGLLEYKPQWTLTLKGWLLIALVLFIGGLIFVKNIQPFLAMYDPIKADFLVVEGWVGDVVSKAALEEFKTKNYRGIITTGSPLLQGSFLSQYKNYAQITAASLVALGVPENQIIVIPAPSVTIDRTAAAAKALKDGIAEYKLKIKAINIYTYDVHARRSRYIYKQVLAPNIKVGVIAFPGDYNREKWWTSSSGLKSVLSESIYYIYTRFFWKN